MNIRAAERELNAEERADQRRQRIPHCETHRRPINVLSRGLEWIEKNCHEMNEEQKTFMKIIVQRLDDEANDEEMST